MKYKSTDFDKFVNLQYQPKIKADYFKLHKQIFKTAIGKQKMEDGGVLRKSKVESIYSLDDILKI